MQKGDGVFMGLSREVTVLAFTIQWVHWRVGSPRLSNPQGNSELATGMLTFINVLIV